ncbi:MAG TPA: phage/plasmid primase, P4 family, partial [Armatimonadota bacterium]|nr:phage/plasmid primase, P4 family [Armatimonadota bacterium]
RPTRPGERGKWAWSLKDKTTGKRIVEPVLYRLPYVLKAAAAGEWVYFAEGEKDVDNLVRLGLCATTNPGGGAKHARDLKWREEFSRCLAGARVVILRDYDPPGKAHAETVARSVAQYAAEVRLPDLPGLGHKGDVSDWLAHGGTREELERLVRDTPPWGPPPDEPGDDGDDSGSAPPRFHLTDAGNAERLVHRHGEDLRYCHPLKRWLVWNGRVWDPDQDGEITRRAIDTIRGMEVEIAMEDDPDRRALLSRHFVASENGNRLAHMLKLAQDQPGIGVKPEHLDRDLWKLNLENGTLDLHTGELRPHERQDLLTRSLPFRYEADAPCPLWLQFLHRVMAGNEEMVDYLQRVAGYCLTGEISEQCFWLHWGRGRNGKSTFLETLSALLGPYSLTARFETFLDSGVQSGNQEGLANLWGRRLVTASEASEGKRLDTTVIKNVTGGEKIRAARKYEHEIEFLPEFKLHLAANHRPRIHDPSDGTWRRLRLVPWTVQIPAAEVDRDLLQKLRGDLAKKIPGELPGILAWAVRGCLDWQQGGLRDPEVVTAATEAYRAESDSVSLFVEDACVRMIGTNLPGTALYSEYQKWCESSGERFPLKRNDFYTRVSDLGFQQYKRG